MCPHDHTNWSLLVTCFKATVLVLAGCEVYGDTHATLSIATGLPGTYSSYVSVFAFAMYLLVTFPVRDTGTQYGNWY